MNALPCGVVAVDEEGQIRYASTRAADLLGYPSVKEVLGNRLLDVVAPEFRDLVADSFSKTQASGRECCLALELTRKDGTRFPGEVCVAALPAESGRSERLVAVLRDTGAGRWSFDLVRAQRDLALALTEARDLDTAVRACLRKALEVAEMDCGAVYLFREETGFLEIIHDTGLSPKFLRSTSRYAPDSANAKLVRKGSPLYVHYEDLGVPIDQTKRDEGLKGIAVVPFSHEGRVIGCLNVASRTFDTFSSDRRHALESIGAQVGATVARLSAEERLRKSEERYRWLADNVTDVVWTADLSLKHTYVSPLVVRQRGFTPEEVLAQTPIEVATEESVSAAGAALAAQLQGDPSHFTDTITLPLEFWHKDGSKVPVEITARLTLDDRGTPNGVIGVSRDISERKRSEAERAEIEEQVRQAQKLEAIGNLAGGVAHDFNNLLAAILGSASVMRMRAKLDKDVLADLERIESAARKAAELTGQLLGFARRGNPRREPVDLNLLVEDVISILKHTIDKRIRIKSRPDREAPIALADRGQIEQVILNLVVNAADAMPEGGALGLQTRHVRLEGVEARRVEVTPGEYLVTTVTDTGTGIPDSIRARIFEPFFTTKPRGKGTGMGLAAAYGIAKDHGGAIAVKSSPGVGSTFSIYLPSSEGRPVREVRASCKPARGRGRVLVVDDEPLVRETLVQTLAALGYHVVVARNGPEALEVCRRPDQPVDVVLLDLSMPVMGGRACLRALRELSPSLRVLISTGHGVEHDIEQLLADGAVAVLRKPYSAEELGEAVAMALPEAR